MSSDRTSEALTEALRVLWLAGYEAPSTTEFLRRDLTWAVPPSGSGGVSDGDKGDVVVSSSGTVWTLDSAVVTTFARTVLDDVDAPSARATLGLTIGTHVQAWDADLDALAALSGTGGWAKRTGAATWTISTPTAADVGAQATDAGLTSLLSADSAAGLVYASAADTWVRLALAADKGIYATSTSALATYDLTAAGRALIDDADAAAQRATLGVVAGGAGDIWVEKAGDTMTGALVLAAGSASAGSWLRYQSGAVLGTPEAGAVEFDGAAVYHTNQTTSGRAQVVDEHIWRLLSAGSAIGPTIADFFGANSSISLPASSVWILEAELYFLKSTAGTVTVTVTNSAANYTSFSGSLEIDAVGGGTGFQAVTRANKHAQTASAQAFPATGSLTDATNHVYKLRCVIQMNAAGNLRIRVTSSAGTVTPGANSWYSCRRIPGNVGTFVA